MESKWFSRDATFYANPDTTKPKKLHLSDYGMAVCAPRTVVLEDREVRLTKEMESARCKRCVAIQERQRAE